MQRRADPPDHYLPNPLSLEEDQRLQQQLRLIDTLQVNAVRLMRATGIRISECINLPLDCLQQISELQVALRVPLGKLHSERFVPVDEETRRVVARIVELGALTPVPEYESQAFLLPRYWQPVTWYRCCTTPYAIWPGLQAALVASTRTGFVTPSRQRWCASASACRRLCK